MPLCLNLEPCLCLLPFLWFWSALSSLYILAPPQPCRCSCASQLNPRSNALVDSLHSKRNPWTHFSKQVQQRFSATASITPSFFLSFWYSLSLSLSIHLALFLFFHFRIDFLVSCLKFGIFSVGFFQFSMM